jgi:hypothetical protein
MRHSIEKPSLRDSDNACLWNRILYFGMVACSEPFFNLPIVLHEATILDEDRPCGCGPGNFWEAALSAALFSSLFIFMYFRSSACGRFLLQFDLIVISGGPDDIF